VIPCLVATAVVDRVEETTLVVEVAGHLVDIPLQSPPEGIGEGSVWEVCLSLPPVSAWVRHPLPLSVAPREAASTL
jgi:hypothetical protein